MRVNMSDVKAFILKRNNTAFDVSSFLCKNTTVWTSGGIPATPAEYFTFTMLEDGTYSIRAKDVTNMPEDVVLPTTYNGKVVTQISEFAFVEVDMSTGALSNTCTTIKSIVIPEGYTAIGEMAFLQCANLERVVLPSTMATIENMAFNTCESLVALFIPASVTSMGGQIINGSDNVTVYCEAASQPSGWASDWNVDNRPVIWGYTPLGDDYLTFTEQTDGTYSIKAADVSNLPSVVGIPFSYNGKAVTAIDENAFYSATINKVVIPEGVTRIGNGAFDNCKRLLDVSLPSTLTEIGGWTFRDCTALTSIVIPIGVTTIGTWAFLRDTSLTINCEASSQPSGWHTDWNLSGGTVVWGYTG